VLFGSGVGVGKVIDLTNHIYINREILRKGLIHQTKVAT